MASAIESSCTAASADPRQRVADELVHHPPAAERRLDEHHARRLGAHLADLCGAAQASPSRRARSAASAASASSGATTATSTPSLATCIGSMPRISAAPGDHRVARAPRASRTSIATPDARASSLRTEATPPRVASRTQRSAGPALLEQRVDRGPQRPRVGLDRRAELELAAREHDRRAVLADRARDEDAVAGAQRRRASGARAGRAARCPVVQMYSWSAWPRSTTFVSPVTISTPAARGRAAIASTSARSTSASRPSSRISDRLSASGPRAGDGEVVDRAVDGELADRAAREADRLDDEAVGGHRELRAADLDRARVGELVERLGGERGEQDALDQRGGRLAARAVGHRDALVAELRALGARGLDDLEDPLLAVGRPCPAGVTSRPPPARARSGRSCSRPRRRPPRRPCTSRSGAPACRRCRRPCTPTA